MSPCAMVIARARNGSDTNGDIHRFVMMAYAALLRTGVELLDTGLVEGEQGVAIFSTCSCSPVSDSMTIPGSASTRRVQQQQQAVADRCQEVVEIDGAE
jgi:hypothetical protein